MRHHLLYRAANDGPGLTRRYAFFLFTILFVAAGLSSGTLAQDINGASRPATPEVTDEHYRIYTGQGDASSLEAIRSAMRSADVVFVGEEHNDPVAHWAELRILVMAAELSDRPVALSMEMFARDDQMIIDEYLSGLITESHFRSAASPWDNYETDYRALVEYAREGALPVVAANAPRRYANMVTRLDRSSLVELSDRAKTYLAPLPYGVPTDIYREQWMTVMMEAMSETDAHGAPADTTDRDTTNTDTTDVHPTDADSADAAVSPDSISDLRAAPPAGMPSLTNMLDAQSLWDATMAYSIAEYQMRNPGTLVVHVVGSFHVESGTGIPEHYARYRPGADDVIIVVTPADDIDRFDSDKYTGAGDFVILSDKSLPRTYDN